MNIFIVPSAKKDLKKLPKEAVTTILKKLYSVKEKPLQHFKRLKGSSLWKLRIGDYRAIVFIRTKDRTIHVVKIGHRKSIYKTNS